MCNKDVLVSMKGVVFKLFLEEEGSNSNFIEFLGFKSAFKHLNLDFEHCGDVEKYLNDQLKGMFYT